MTRHDRNPYGNYGIYGAPAYDFKPIGNENPGQYSFMAAPHQNGDRSRRSFRPAFLVACVLCVLLLGYGLYSRNCLVEISARCFELRLAITELGDEQERLKLEHELMFSPEKTEHYAINELGMQRPAAEQICIIDANAQENAADLKK